MKEEQEREGMSRRDFVRGMIAGGAGLYVSQRLGAEGPQAWARNRQTSGSANRSR